MPSQRPSISERLWRGLATRVAEPIIERGLLRPESARRNGRRINERQVEYRFVFDCLNRFTPDSVLDVGSGRTSLPHLIWVCGYRWPRSTTSATTGRRRCTTGTSWSATST